MNSRRCPVSSAFPAEPRGQTAPFPAQPKANPIMPTKLSLKEMIDVADVHTRYELTHEIEPLMATVHPEPCWIVEPIGCEIASFEGVSQWYQRMFPLIGAGG